MWEHSLWVCFLCKAGSCGTLACVHQAELLSAVASMVSSFAARRSEEVAGAVAGMQASLTRDERALGSSFQQLQTTVTAGVEQLQVGGRHLFMLV